MMANCNVGDRVVHDRIAEQEMEKSLSPPKLKYDCCREKDRAEAADCMASLCTAIQESGGSVESITTKIKGGLTVMQFIVSVASQNHIRFHFEGPEEE